MSKVLKHIQKPSLKYPIADGLAPACSTETLDFHHGKHHMTYYNNLVNLITGTKLSEMKLEDIVVESHNQPDLAAVFNNAAQLWNHSFFFDGMCPGGSPLSGAVSDQIHRKWGDVHSFQDQFSQNAVGVFGSGWTWLVDTPGGFEIINTFNAGTPLTEKEWTPLLCCDVWEHAYYLQYQNRRPEWLKSFWQVVDWTEVNARMVKKNQP